MKKRYTKIIATILLAIPLLVAVVPHLAFANWFTDGISAGFWTLTAYITELEMAIAGGMVTITGSLLNATLTATLNMSKIVDATPAIGTTWTTIRDFSSIFIIFMLLAASIKIILGMGSDVGKLIRNIVIAGLLINFSMFFTKIAIDASNIISLSFYSAIAPCSLGQNNCATVSPSASGAGATVGALSVVLDDGGLSNVFMQSLDLQAFANASSSVVGSNLSGDKNFNITLAQSGASVLMFFAAISFLAAAIAFAVRIGILILLMAFSPVYFIALVFPDLKEYSDKWARALYGMCIFMPAYLFLMYVAMSVINDPSFFNFAKPAASAASGSVTGSGLFSHLISSATIGIVLQYIIAIILINTPLLVAIEIGSKGADVVGKVLKNTSKWGQGAITGAHKGSFGFLAQHGIGRGARATADSTAFKSFVKDNPFLGTLAAQGLKGVAGSSFGGTKGGYDKRSEKYSKTRQDVAKSLELSDSEASKHATINYSTWVNDTNVKKKELAAEIARMNGDDLSDDDKRYAAMGAENLKKEIDTREKRDFASFEKEAKSMYQREYAKNLEKDAPKGFDWITKNARKDAAEKIRKSINKGKDKKLLDAFKEYTSDDKEKEDKKEKP